MDRRAESISTRMNTGSPKCIDQGVKLKGLQGQMGNIR